MCLSVPLIFIAHAYYYSFQCVWKSTLPCFRASGFNDVASVEDHSLELAVEETYQNTESGGDHGAKNARSLRVGDIVLIVDADTNVPEVSNPTRRATGSQLDI